MIRGRNYKHSVELFKAVQVLDSYSMPVTSFVSLGVVPAAVKVLTGSRAMYYQEVGVTNPVQVEIRNPGTTEIAKKLGVPERAVISVIASGKSRLIGLIFKGDS